MKRELPGATALKIDKRKKHRNGRTQASESLSQSQGLFMWKARKFKVALRRKATEIEDVLMLVFKDHLQSIGSLLY